MRPKRSKSTERERKHRQRENLSEEKKEVIRKNDANSQLESRKLETEEMKRKRIENMAEYKEKRIDFSSPTGMIEKRRKRLRLKKGIGLVNAIAIAVG